MTTFRLWQILAPGLRAAFVFAALLGVFSGPRIAYAATVSGDLKVAGGKKLKNLIVFLEPVNAMATKAMADIIVTQKDRVFKPGVVVVVAGSKIVFHNDEERDIDHNVYSLSKTQKFDIGLISKGKKLVVDFPKPGIVKYYCSVHKNMEGSVIVVPSPFYAIVKEPGPFTINNVPAGEWKLNVSFSHRHYSVTPVNVTIAEGPVDNLTLEIAKKKLRKN
ncbi:MAG: plastocyanin/azurin family copper-binding protein [Proteobacteria bacterium]|nr:plastocyanin/azurin family copper-binding protein [Pseudomonadota bacterium]